MAWGVYGLGVTWGVYGFGAGSFGLWLGSDLGGLWLRCRLLWFIALVHGSIFIFKKPQKMKTFQYSFEKLEVWQKAKLLVIAIYKMSKKFPDEEKFGLCSQMKRAAISVCSNIAEGSARKSPKDQANFTTISFSSLMELLNQLIIAFELGYIEEPIYFQIRTEIEKISLQLNKLRITQLKATPKP